MTTQTRAAFPYRVEKSSGPETYQTKGELPDVPSMFR
jgi:hypothetical protein